MIAATPVDSVFERQPVGCLHADPSFSSGLLRRVSVQASLDGILPLHRLPVPVSLDAMGAPWPRRGIAPTGVIRRYIPSLRCVRRGSWEKRLPSACRLDAVGPQAWGPGRSARHIA